MAGPTSESDLSELIRHTLREELRYFAETALRGELAALRHSLTHSFEINSPHERPSKSRSPTTEEEEEWAEPETSRGVSVFRRPLDIISPIAKATGLAMLFNRRTTHGPDKDGTAHAAPHLPQSCIPAVGTDASARHCGYVPLPPGIHHEMTGQPDEQIAFPRVDYNTTSSLSSSEYREKQAHISLFRAESAAVPSQRDSEVFDFAETQKIVATEQLGPNCARALLLTGWVYPLTGVLLTMNSISIGLEADYMARNKTDQVPVVYRICDIAFLVYFVLEIALRLHAYRFTFFTRRTSAWNMFDLGMVILQLADVMILELSRHWTQVARNIIILRSFRILRILRIFRFFRILHMFSGLRMLIIAVHDSLKSLAWSLFLILLMIYSLGVCLTQVVTNHKIHNAGGGGSDELEFFYGSVQSSMLSLYEAISDGIHWHDLMEPLRQNCSPWMALLFSMYMAFSMFAMLNVITGIFVERALETAKQDKREILMTRMKALFLEADDDGSGALDRNEFERHLGGVQMDHLLKEVDLNVHEAMDLFYILDTQGDGEIKAEAFVNGCLRLHGSAKAIDLAAFMHEFNLFQHKWQEDATFQREAVRKIYKQVHQLLSRSAGGSSTDSRRP